MKGQLSHPLNLPASGLPRSLKLRTAGRGAGTYKDHLYLLALVLTAFAAVYFIPQSFTRIIFLAFLVLFWNSKRDYIWFALFFILVQQPGWFFADFSRTGLYRIPLYNFLPSMSVTAIDLFVVVALIKAWMKGKKRPFKLKRPALVIFIYMLFSICLSIIHGAGVTTLANLLRGPFYYSIVISFLYLIKSKDEVFSFIKVIMPYVLFLLFTQIYDLITRTEFVNVFYAGFRSTFLIEGTGQVRATPGGFLIVFFSFLFAFFLIENKTHSISKRFLYLIISTSFLIVVISATRVWFVVFLFVFVFYIFISRRKVSNSLKIITLIVLLMVVLVMSGAISSDFFSEAVFPRLTAVSSVIGGDYDAIPTFRTRYFFRLPRLLAMAKQNLIFGVGFTKEYFQYSDYHVGFFNTILQFGILGFVCFLYFFLSYFVLIRKTVKRLAGQNPYRQSLRFLSVAFSGILVAHFWTWYFFPMDGNSFIPFFIAVFIALTEFFINEAENHESEKPV